MRKHGLVEIPEKAAMLSVQPGPIDTSVDEVFEGKPIGGPSIDLGLVGTNGRAAQEDGFVFVGYRWKDELGGMAYALCT